MDRKTIQWRLWYEFVNIAELNFKSMIPLRGEFFRVPKEAVYYLSMM